MGNSHQPPLLEFHNATVLRGNTTALDSVSIRINSGENVAVIGPNGSGKSTLIKLVTRECYPVLTNGVPPVRIMGESTWDIFRLRAMMGVVSGDWEEFFRRDLSGREVILSGFFGSVGLYPYHRVTPKMGSRADEILSFLEIDHLAEKSMTSMSTGEARRVMIGRALVHRPRALILDEPANGLDPHAARRFGDSLRKLARAGKSIILVTHHLPDIIPEVSRVIMLKDGKVFADGSKREVLTNDQMSELFGMRVEVFEKNGYHHLLA